MNHPGANNLGLALGSGAARGLAHIGVLKVLESEGIVINCVAGTSIGAIFGAMHASGLPASQIAEVACNVDWKRLVRLIDPILPTSGLIDGKKVVRFMEELLPVRTFEELSIPLAVVTADIETGEMVVIKQGGLIQALRAAIAFPGIFTPVCLQSRFLMDGGLCNPVPIDVARQLGATQVIGVSTLVEVDKKSQELSFPFEDAVGKSKPLPGLMSPKGVEMLLKELWSKNGNPGRNVNNIEERRPPNIFRICAQSVAIMENEISSLRLRQDPGDLLLRPELSGFTLLEFHRAEEIIAAGEKAARQNLPRLKALRLQD